MNTNLFFRILLLPNFLRFEVKNIKIDHEYSCVWHEEFLHLTQHGIKYTFVKTIDGTTVWKFRKTQQLFECLASFYQDVYSK